MDFPVDLEYFTSLSSTIADKDIFRDVIFSDIGLVTAVILKEIESFDCVLSTYYSGELSSIFIQFDNSCVEDKDMEANRCRQIMINIIHKILSDPVYGQSIIMKKMTMTGISYPDAYQWRSMYLDDMQKISLLFKQFSMSNSLYRIYFE